MDRREFFKRTGLFIAAGAAYQIIPGCSSEKTVMPWDKDPNFNPGGNSGDTNTDAVVGSALPLWTEGCFDIHHINTGRGECSFLIFPDGTSMIIDAGEVNSTSTYPFVPMRPSEASSAPDTYYRYISHFLPSVCKGKLDYMMLTHFHGDHLGTPSATVYSMNTAGNYRKTGMMALYDMIKCGKWVDRSYPDYTDSALQTTDYTSGYSQLANFTAYNIKNNGLKCEKFNLGSSSQFQMTHDASKYDFKAENVCSNGYVSYGGKTTDFYGAGATRYENGMSNGMLFTYGSFRYLSCGDQNTGEAALAEALGIHVDAMKADHHMSVNTQKTALMSVVKPRVVITQSFYQRDDQPNPSVIKNLYDSYAGEKNLYFTNVVEAQQTAHADAYGQASGINGHVVIRVAPGGTSYYVFMLDDTDYSYKVKQIDGPFNCI